MSFYNMLRGFNPACYIFLPMLGRKQNEYPRFRDCFVDEDEKHILIYTRVGGGNRGCGYGEEKLYEDPNFVDTWDDEYDNTYGFYKFKVPERWQKDFDAMMEGDGDLTKASDEYVQYVKEFFPKLTEEGIIDMMFKKK